MALCIAFGFFMQLNLSFGLNVLCLISSNMCILSTLWLVKSDLYVNERTGEDNKSVPSTKYINSPKIITAKEKSKTLSYLLFILFPLFPTIHLLTMFGILDHNLNLILNMIAGLAAKLGFTAIAVKSHRNVLDSLVSRLDDGLQPFIYKIIAIVDTSHTNT